MKIHPHHHLHHYQLHHHHQQVEMAPSDLPCEQLENLQVIYRIPSQEYHPPFLEPKNTHSQKLSHHSTRLQPSLHLYEFPSCFQTPNQKILSPLLQSLSSQYEFPANLRQ
ncbi:hypothetical protein TorRG33x02_298570 [Trema orientale]|uniref:Uncharacterized protein n=1 Tax=Trema orientale TaxID=63057 RepID=A0A2P5C3V9_TREOI|nr:hypothetical protein TorRG33x02_298570 [Trema orientale]